MFELAGPPQKDETAIFFPGTKLDKDQRSRNENWVKEINKMDRWMRR